jgi:hypothetical protein
MLLKLKGLFFYKLPQMDGCAEDGGHCRTRTCDLVRVKHAL